MHVAVLSIAITLYSILYVNSINDIALRCDEWPWLMKVEKHYRQKSKLLSLFCTCACNEYMNRVALVSLPDNVFQLFFTLLH